MIKDITLGQYFPGKSFIHRLDPRMKLLITLIYMIVLFSIKNIIGYAVIALFILLILGVAKIPIKTVLKSVRPLAFIILFTAILNIFYTRGGEPLFEWRFITITSRGLLLSIFMVLRIIFLVIGTSLLTYTTSPISLTDAIENILTPFKKIKVPAHEIAMMMTIALRFIPTLIEETQKIMNAQKARGADFEGGSLTQRARALVPVLVPLFVSSFRRADDLATAMECRCYRGDINRTRLKVLKMGKIDMFALFYVTVFAALTIAINFLPYGWKL